MEVTFTKGFLKIKAALYQAFYPLKYKMYLYLLKKYHTLLLLSMFANTNGFKCINKLTK